MDEQNSQHVVSFIVNQILTIAQSKISLRKLIKKAMLPYTMSNYQKYSYQIQKQQKGTIPQTQFYSIQNQPTALFRDNLMPISTDLQNNNDYKSTLNKSFKQSDQDNKKLQYSKHKVPLKKQQQQKPFVELDFQIKEEQHAADGLILQLRKNKQDKEKLQRLQAHNNDNKKVVQAKPKNGKEQKISYDYDGELIKIKTNPKNNLITHFLNSNPSKQIIKQKQVLYNSQTTTIQSNKMKKDIKRTKRNDQIFFSDIKTLLQQVSVSKGTKYMHNKIILEQKQKKLSIKDIKKSLSTSRISKNDYIRLKQANGLNGQVQQAPQEQKPIMKKDEGLKKRSNSQTFLGTQRINKGIIKINNQKLKDTLLTKITIHDIPEVNQTITMMLDQKEQSNKIKLDFNDEYNLDYIQGSSANKNKSISSISSNFKLPRLSVMSNIIQPRQPKIRQKIKDQVTLRRQLRKKFQDKLRL